MCKIVVHCISYWNLLCMWSTIVHDLYINQMAKGLLQKLVTWNQLSVKTNIIFSKVILAETTCTSA